MRVSPPGQPKAAAVQAQRVMQRPPHTHRDHHLPLGAHSSYELSESRLLKEVSPERGEGGREKVWDRRGVERKAGEASKGERSEGACQGSQCSNEVITSAEGRAVGGPVRRGSWGRKSQGCVEKWQRFQSVSWARRTRRVGPLPVPVPTILSGPEASFLVLGTVPAQMILNKHRLFRSPISPEEGQRGS